MKYHQMFFVSNRIQIAGLQANHCTAETTRKSQHCKYDISFLVVYKSMTET